MMWLNVAKVRRALLEMVAYLLGAVLLVAGLAAGAVCGSLGG